jgi:hypothetical protein
MTKAKQRPNGAGPRQQLFWQYAPNQGRGTACARHGSLEFGDRMSVAAAPNRIDASPSRSRPSPSDQGFILSSACCIGTEETLMNPANGRSMSKIRFRAIDTENAPANMVAMTVAFNGAKMV